MSDTITLFGEEAFTLRKVHYNIGAMIGFRRTNVSNRIMYMSH